MDGDELVTHTPTQRIMSAGGTIVGAALFGLTITGVGFGVAKLALDDSEDQHDVWRRIRGVSKTFAEDHLKGSKDIHNALASISQFRHLHTDFPDILGAITYNCVQMIHFAKKLKDPDKTTHALASIYTLYEKVVCRSKWILQQVMGTVTGDTTTELHAAIRTFELVIDGFRALCVHASQQTRQMQHRITPDAK